MKAEMRTEMKNVVNRVKAAQEKFETMVNTQGWVDEARKYAEKHGKEVKKLISADASLIKSFLERERKDLAKFQKKIPSEVKKIKSYVMAQRKEVEKLISDMARQSKGTKTKSKVKTKSKTKSTMTTAAKKTSKKTSKKTATSANA